MWIVPEDTKIVTLKINKQTLQDLHERYGHISFDTLKPYPKPKDYLDLEPEPVRPA